MARITKEGMTAIEVIMPKEAKARLDEFAREQSPDTQGRKVYATDIVRLALTEYFQRLGENIDFDVDRGGYRPRRKSE